MIYAVLFYWLSCGWATWCIPTKSTVNEHHWIVFLFCMLFGGIVVPGRLIAKRIR